MEWWRERRVRLPARTTLESLVASVRSLVERQVSLQQLIAPFGVTAWSGLASRVERRNTLSSELVVVDAKLAAALGSDTLETIHNRDCDLGAARTRSWPWSRPGPRRSPMSRSFVRLSQHERRTANRCR
jgi:hypothetical protein